MFRLHLRSRPDSVRTPPWLNEWLLRHNGRYEVVYNTAYRVILYRLLVGKSRDRLTFKHHVSVVGSCASRCIDRARLQPIVSGTSKIKKHTARRRRSALTARRHRRDRRRFPLHLVARLPRPPRQRTAHYYY